VAQLLSDEAKRTAQLRDGQFSSRKNRSVIDAAAIMVDRVQSAWKADIITGVRLIDIKAAFTSVARGRLIQAMIAKRIDGDLIGLTESFHSDRTVDMVIKGNVLDSHPVEAGIQQGSPVSSILFAIYTTALIKWVEESVQGGKGWSFVGDLQWVSSGIDAHQVVSTLEDCEAESIIWVSRRDIQVDTAKTESALLTCKML